jgi:hypothetical protein
VAVIVAAAAWLVAEGIWAVTARPGPVVDYHAELRALAAARQPGDDDAWPHLRDAARALAAVEGEFIDEARADDRWSDFIDFNRLLARELDESAVRAELRALETLRGRGVFESLARAAATRRVVRPVVGEPLLVNLSLPESGRLHALARARTGSMRIAARRGDDAELVAAFEQTLAIGRAFAGQPLLIDQLYGTGIGELALREMRFTLDEHELDEATGRALLDVLDRQTPYAPVADALEGERLIGLEAIQWCFTDDGHGDGRLRLDRAEGLALGGGMGPPTVAGMTGIVTASRRETTDALNDFYDRVIAESRLSPAGRLASPFSPTRFVASLSARQVFVTLMLPAIDRMMHGRDVFDLHLAGTRVMIALEIAEARDGRIPGSLAELAPDILPEPPADPMHGGPFIYRPRPGGGYVLYSTGLYGVDDSKDADLTHPEAVKTFGQAQWSAQAAIGVGYDALINRRRNPDAPPAGPTPSAR